MVITCDDLLFEEFHMADYGLVCWNGSDGEIDDTEDMKMTPVSTSVFNGESPRRNFISQKYGIKLDKLYNYNPEYIERSIKSGDILKLR